MLCTLLTSTIVQVIIYLLDKNRKSVLCVLAVDHDLSSIDEVDQAQQTFCVVLLAKLPGPFSYLLCIDRGSPHVLRISEIS